MVNLLSNAVKFSSEEATVTIVVKKQDNCIVVEVSDEGRGIPAHLLRSIFDRFQQVKSADSKQERGSGLGLAICKALIELHGGEIACTSEVGKGSTFTFSLPGGWERQPKGKGKSEEQMPVPIVVD